MELSPAHWNKNAPGYKQRMTTAQWREILLAGRDSIIVRGLLTTLVARKLGAGVVEVGVPEVQKEPDNA